MNSGKNVNTSCRQGATTERALAVQLRELLESIPWLQAAVREAARGEGWDLVAEVRVREGHDALFRVECKQQVSPSQLQGLLASRGPAESPDVHLVLAAPRISERVAELCTEAGWGWFDLAGNARLEVPGVLLLERTGRPPLPAPGGRTTSLESPEAARVLRAILATENAGQRWTQRGIREHLSSLDVPLAAPSLGLVNKVVGRLRDEAFIEEQASGGFALIDALGLLAAFSKAYRFDRVRRVGLFTSLKQEQLQDALADLDREAGGHAAFAAFSAADRQAAAVRQPMTWVMVAAPHEQRLRQLAEAREVDSGENLVALVPEDDGPFYLAQSIGNAPTMRCTNQVQTYLDLQRVGGRGEEAAEAVLEKCLKPAWVAAGVVRR